MISLLYKIFSNNHSLTNAQIINSIRHFNTNRTIIKNIIKFILRFKLIGDQLQAIEASNNPNYPINQSLVNHKRILTTQDRVLCAYCLIHEDVSFISKTTIGGKKYLLWNYNY